MNQDFYSTIRQILESARQKVYATANTAMVHAYWLIGERIVAEQGGNEKSEYGSGLLQELSRRMTQDYGKGFTVTNLKYMRQFYIKFQNGHALRDELTWTHYRLLLKVEDDAARAFYLDECVKARWSSRQLERQINSFYFQTHQDIGQMDTYVRLFDDLERGSDDNPTIGIVLCTQKNEAVAKYSVLNDGKNIFASKYQLTLPTAEELQKYLEDERRKFKERQDIS